MATNTNSMKLLFWGKDRYWEVRPKGNGSSENTNNIQCVGSVFYTRQDTNRNRKRNTYDAITSLWIEYTYYED